MIPKDVIARFGLADTLIIACSKALRLVSRSTIDIGRYYLFAQPLEMKTPRRRSAGAQSAVRAVTADDKLLAAFPRPAAEVAERFANGAQCFAYEGDGKVLGFAWFQSGSFGDTEVRAAFRPQPEPSTVWDFDVYVDPAKRGGLVFFRLWEGAGQALLARGVTHSVSRVWTHNEDSVRSHMSLGAYPVGSIVQLRIGAVFVSLADRKPRVSIVFGSGEAPVFDVPADATARRRYRRFPSRPPQLPR
jgi:GNAT superfamily N-acetyltransferase